jgi:RNase P subunit RPR2
MRKEALMKLNPEKPKYKFCWHCSKLLYGGRGVKIVVDNIERWVHAACKDLPEDEFISGSV